MLVLFKMIYDAHAHLDYFNEDELNEIVSAPNVNLIISNSTNLQSCKKNLKLSQQYEKIKLAAGLYPEENLKLSDLTKLKKFIQKNKSEVIAIGEIGMDFSHPLPDKKLQEKIFKEQLKLAKELNVPAIIHTRKAEKEVIEILEKHKDQKIILPFFHANFKLIKKAEELGFYFNIPTNIVKSQHFQKMVKELPKDKILTETDAPYLSPHERKKNQPAFIKESIKIIVKIWNTTEKKVEKQIEDNFNKLFKT